MASEQKYRWTKNEVIFHEKVSAVKNAVTPQSRVRNRWGTKFGLFSTLNQLASVVVSSDRHQPRQLGGY